MYALTLIQPWAALVAEGIKLIENRSWQPTRGVLGQRIAIHAGLAKPDKAIEHAVGLARTGVGPLAGAVTRLPPPWMMSARGAILGTAVVEGFIMGLPGSAENLAEKWQRGQGIWFQGPYGWQLRDVRTAEKPIHCSGRQRLWTVDDAVELELKARGLA